MSPITGSGDHLFMSSDSGVGLQRSSSGANLIHQQMSEGNGPNQRQPGSMTELQQMRSNDMFQRMTSIDGMDMLDPATEFALHDTSNLDLMSPRSWGNQEVTPSAQVPPYRPLSGSDHMPVKRAGRPRGSKNQLERQQHFQRTQSIDDPSLPGYGSGQQSSLYGRDSPFQGSGSTSFPGENSRGIGNGGSSYPNQGQQMSIGSLPGQENFQRSLSFQGHAGGRMAPDTDPEHSILGNLLKGRSGSTSSASGKSPVQSVLVTTGRSTGPSAGLYRSGKSPVTQSTICDRGGRSPAHSVISDGVSPISVFSPDSSQPTPSVIKGELLDGMRRL